MIEFAKLTKDEQKNVTRIAKRAIAMFGNGRDLLDWEMDLGAVHQHTPLDFKRLAEAGDGDFGHDLGGISHHLDRETGELTNYFLPRTALPQGIPSKGE